MTVEKGVKHTAEEIIDLFLREDRVWHNEVRTHGGGEGRYDLMAMLIVMGWVEVMVAKRGI